MGDFDRLSGLAERVCIDRVAVVLGADGNLPGVEILPGLVSAVVSELELDLSPT